MTMASDEENDGAKTGRCARCESRLGRTAQLTLPEEGWLLGPKSHGRRQRPGKRTLACRPFVAPRLRLRQLRVATAMVPKVAGLEPRGAGMVAIVVGETGPARVRHLERDVAVGGDAENHVRRQADADEELQQNRRPGGDETGSAHDDTLPQHPPQAIARRTG